MSYYVTPPAATVAGIGVALSPDASPIVNLTVYDRTSTDLYNEAIGLVKVLFPEWQPAAGNIEVVLLQSLAAIVAEEVFAINRLPVTVVQSLLLMAGVTPSPGSQATAQVVFNLTDNPNGTTIPPGTLLSLQMSEGRSFTFATQQTAYLPPGVKASAPTSIRCTAFSATPNNTRAGTVLAVPVGAYAISNAVLATPVTGGSDPETASAWVSRGTQVLQRLSSTLVTPAQITQAALSSDPTVWRCRVTNNWDPTLNGGNGASALGHVTVSVYGKSNPANPGAPSPVGQDHKTALFNLISAQAQANLAIHVVDASVTTASVHVVVVRAANVADADCALSVQNAVFGWANTDSWQWDAAIRYMELIDVIDNAPGVGYVTDVQINGTHGDIDMDGIANLANAAQVNVTVLDPQTAPSTAVTVILEGVYTGSASPSDVNAAVTAWAQAAIGTGRSPHTLLYTELVTTIAQVSGVTGVYSAYINGQRNDLTVVPAVTTLGSVAFGTPPAPVIA